MSKTSRAGRASGMNSELTVCIERLRRVRGALARTGCDAFLISNPADVGYLAPFSGEASAALITTDEYWILSDRRFEEELRSATSIAKVALRKGGMADTMAEAVRAVGAKRIAVQGDSMTVDMLGTLAKKLRGRRIVPTTGILAELRAVKGPEELAAIRKGIDIQQKALKWLLPQIRPGQTETEIAGALEHQMRRLGAQGTSFPSIVAVAGNAAKPHARPGSAKVRSGQVLLIDWGARADGYCSDMTRTFAIGKWPKEIDRVYDVVLRAFHAGVKAVGPGVRCADVDRAARKVIEDAGLGQFFGHGLGHGIGLDIHEEPRVASISKGVLRPGHVVTIEPGVYLPGIGGVRIEDDILVTGDGRRNLCSLPKDKDWATL